MRLTASLIVLLVLAVLVSSPVFPHAGERLDIFLLDVSSSMVQVPECAYEQDDTGTWRRAAECSTPLAMAVDYLAKRLEIIDQGTVAIMLFSGRKGGRDFIYADHPLNDIDQNPGIESDDGPIRSTYLFQLGDEGFHSDLDKLELLNFLRGGDFTYRALPEDPIQEGSNVRVGAIPGLGDETHWPGLAVAMESMYVDQVKNGSTAYADGPLWRGLCTSIFDSIVTAIELAQTRGPFERVSLTVLTDWRNEQCAQDQHTGIASVRPLVEALCEEMRTASSSAMGTEVAFTYLFWKEPPDPSEFALDASCSSTTIVDVTEPFYSIHMDRTRYAFDPVYRNAWYDRDMKLQGCSIRYVDRVDPATGGTETDTEAEVRIILSLGLPGALDQGIELAEGFDVLPSPIRAGDPWDLEIALVQDTVRDYVLTLPELSGDVRGELLFEPEYVGTASHDILPIPPGMVRVPYHIPNVVAEPSNDGKSLFFDLKPNGAFLDDRNDDHSVYVDFDPLLFELLVDGDVQESPVVHLTEGYTRVTLKPRNNLAAGTYADTVSVKHRGNAEALVNGESVYRTDIDLHVVGFSRDEIVFTENLWHCNPTGDIKLTAGLEITGINPDQLSVEAVDFGLTGVDVRPSLTCDSTHPGSCVITLNISPWEAIRREEAIDLTSPRAICFAAQPSTGQATRLVVYKNDDGCLPVLLTYREMWIEVDLGQPLGGVWEQGDDTSCVQVGPDATLAEIEVTPSEDLDPSTTEAYVHLFVVDSEGLEKPFGVQVGREEETTDETGGFRLDQTATLKPVLSDAAKNVVCNRGYIRIRPVDPDVILRDGGDCYKEIDWEYDYRLLPTCGVIQTLNGQFTFRKAAIENRVSSLEQVEFGSEGKAPSRGRILVRAEGVRIEEEVDDSPSRPVAGDLFQVATLEPPFSGIRDFLAMTVAPQVLDIAEGYEKPIATGSLVFRYEPPVNATTDERCTCFETPDGCVNERRVPFTVDLWDVCSSIEILTDRLDFGNAFLANPVCSEQVLVLADTGEAPESGAIHIRAEGVKLHRENEPERALAGESFTLQAIPPPFVGEKGKLCITADPDVLEMCEDYRTASAVGELVFTYEPLPNTDPGEGCAKFLVDGEARREVRILFTVQLDLCHVKVDVERVNEGPADIAEEEIFRVTARHSDDLGRSLTELANPQGHFTVGWTVEPDTGTLVWSLRLRSDCDAVPIGYSAGELRFHVPGFPAADFCGDVSGTGEAVYTYQLHRTALVHLDPVPNEPRRIGKKHGEDIDVWRRGDAILTLKVDPKAGTDCLDSAQRILSLEYDGPTDNAGRPYVCLVTADAPAVCLDELPLGDASTTYDVGIQGNAPRGRVLVGDIIVAASPDSVSLEGNANVHFRFHVENRLAEILRVVAIILRALGLAPFALLLAYMGIGTAIEALRQVFRLGGTGRPPWRLIADFMRTRKWVLIALGIALAVSGVAWAGIAILGQWTA